MESFINKVHNLIERYNEQLSSAGIKITVSKKYFESDVQERSGGANLGQSVFNYLDRAKDRKAEKEYNYERNKYHCVVLSVLPIDKNLIPKKNCKDYSFLLKKVERAHIGLKPEHIIYEESKIILKIEKRIQKIIKTANKTNISKACKNTFFDAIRYSHSKKYEYKHHFCGKDRFFWEMLFAVSAGLLTILIVFIAWIIYSLL